MTTADLLEQLTTILQDPDGTRWSSPELTAYLDEAQTDFGSRTGMLATTATLGAHATLTTPANAFYALPTNVMALDGIQVDGAPIGPISLSVFPDQYKWTAAEGMPVGYLHGPFGPNAVRLYPIPSSSPVVVAYYTKVPASLATAEPEIPAAWHMALVYHAASRAYLKDFEAKDASKAGTFGQLYEDRITAALKHAPSQPRTIGYRHL